MTDAQIAFYRREGYLIYDQPILPRQKFLGLVDHFERKLAALPEGRRPEHMDVPHFTDPTLFEWLFANEVLDLVEPLIGPDIALWSSHFICKRAGDGKRVPWHEDSGYWRDLLDPMEVVTIWLAIDRSDEGNGCMKVVPRTFEGNHETEPVDREKNVFNAEIKSQFFDASQAVPCILEPNHASLHDGRLIHGSDHNFSERRRCGYTMRYMSTRVRFNHEKFGQWHQIYLARGRDLSGNVYANPGVSYDEFMRTRIQAARPGH